MAILYPECYTEKFLCEYLGYSKDGYEKCIGKPAVITKIQSITSSTIAIGIVDEDAMSSSHPDYKLYESIESSYGMRLLRHRTARNRFLIEFNGNFESWVKNINKKAKVQMDSINMDRLHGYTGVTIPDNYKKFLKKIFEKYPEPINKINKWIADCETNI